MEETARLNRSSSPKYVTTRMGSLFRIPLLQRVSNVLKRKIVAVNEAGRGICPQRNLTFFDIGDKPSA